MVQSLWIGHQTHQCLIEIGGIADPWRHRALKVERTALAGGDGGTPPGQRIAQEAAAAHLARNETAPLSLLIGAGDGPDGDAKLPCKRAMRGQLVTRCETAGFQICANGLRDCEIAGELRIEIWCPTCHGDNVSIDRYISWRL